MSNNTYYKSIFSKINKIESGIRVWFLFFLGLKQIRKYILELYLCTKIMAATTASSRMQPPNITIETTCVDVLAPLLYSVDVFRSIIILQYLLQNSWSLYAVFYELEMCLWIKIIRWKNDSFTFTVNFRMFQIQRFTFKAREVELKGFKLVFAVTFYICRSMRKCESSIAWTGMANQTKMSWSVSRRNWREEWIFTEICQFCWNKTYLGLAVTSVKHICSVCELVTIPAQNLVHCLENYTDKQ